MKKEYPTFPSCRPYPVVEPNADEGVYSRRADGLHVNIKGEVLESKIKASVRPNPKA